MILKTESGSIYMIDAPGRRIRQLQGKPTARINRNGPGQWSEYEDIIVRMGRAMVISWPSSVPVHEGSPPDAKPVTITSPVVVVDHSVAPADPS